MRHIIRQHVRKGALVTLKSGEAVRGVLFDADRDAFVLRAFQTFDAEGRMTPGDGELVILREDIAYMQFV